jgi:tetraacyldisaccharide 4'-kinase
MRAPNYWHRKTPGAKAFTALLSPLAAAYGLGVKFSRKHKKTFQPRANIVCVGNLTLGGAGKTPIAIALAEYFLEHGAKVMFLSRGYQGRLAGPVGVELTFHCAADVGDEPLLLARTAPTIVSRDRAAGAKMADSLGADIVIMDDGHQNFSLKKDFSFVVIDAATRFGNGRLFPAGPLREPLAEGLARADAIIIFGNEKLPLPEFTGPILRANLVPKGDSELTGKKCVLFAGIGRPEKFFDTVSKMGGQICATQSFSDHHHYSESDIRKLRASAVELNASLVTTEKDFVRIASHLRDNILTVPVRVLFKDKKLLHKLLDKLTKSAGKSAT